VADEGGEDHSIATFGAFDGGTGRATLRAAVIVSQAGAPRVDGSGICCMACSSLWLGGRGHAVIVFEVLAGYDFRFLFNERILSAVCLKEIERDWPRYGPGLSMAEMAVGFGDRYRYR
jgi:hypothetical protein